MYTVYVTYNLKENESIIIKILEGINSKHKTFQSEIDVNFLFKQFKYQHFMLHVYTAKTHIQKRSTITMSINSLKNSVIPIL